MKHLITTLLILFYTNSFAQNVGIGETNPTESKLQIKTADSAALLIQNTATPNGTKTGFFLKSDGNYSGSIATVKTAPATYRMGLYTFGGAAASALQERVSILDNGNVGIGTTNPTAKLDVNGTVKIADGTQDVDKVLTSDAAGNAKWSSPAYDSSINTGFWTNQSASQPFATSFLPILASEKFDDGNNVLNGIFTAPADGLYHFNANASFSFSNLADQATIQLVLESPTSTFYGSQSQLFPIAFTGVADIQATTIVKLNKNNQVQTSINVYGTSGLQTLTRISLRGYRIY